MSDNLSRSTFTGAKLMLFLGGRLVVLLRDDISGIPYPGHWDFPGGGREGQESPETCVRRETWEETGLTVPQAALCWRRFYPSGPAGSFLFAAHLSADREAELRLGDEGQALRLMSPADYLEHPGAIPHFAQRLCVYLDQI